MSEDAPSKPIVRRCTILHETQKAVRIKLKSNKQLIWIPKSKCSYKYKAHNPMTFYEQAVVEVDKEFWNEKIKPTLNNE